MDAPRVLIIDDEPILLNTLASTLRRKLPDVHIETMDSALAALNLIRATDYAAILCDAHQSRLEGIGFVRAVQKVRPDLRDLLLLEKHNDDLFSQGVRAGVYGVLIKPVEEGTLLLAVGRAIEVSHLRTAVKREEERFLADVRNMLRNLASLYGAYGLQAHFDAFLSSVNAEKTACPPSPGLPR